MNTTLNGLATATTYYFRVCAENSKGYSEGQIISFTTTSPGGLPTVTTLAATLVGATEATLNGNVTPNGQATTAWFEWGTDSALSTFSTTLSQSVGSGATSQSVTADLTGLSTGVTYYYRVAANNSSGTIKGSILSFSFGIAAPVVTTMFATSVGLTTATMNGNVTANYLPTTAWFEWGTDQALSTFSSTSSQSVGSGATSQSVTADLAGLSTGVTYYYRVAANNSSGTTKGGILSFTAAKPWGTAVQIDAGVGDAAAQAQVAIDGSGNAVAVWGQGGGAQYSIWSNHYTASTGTWGTAVQIGAGGRDVDYPRVAVDASGNAVAMWAESDGTRYNIWSNRYTASTGTWGTPVLIETDNAGDALRPEVAVDGSGNAVVVWQQSDGTRQNMWSNRYNASTGTWGTAMLIETGAGNGENPKVAVDGSGNAVAVWPQEEEGTQYTSIWSNHYIASTGTWATAILIETGAESAWEPRVAVDGSGNAIAVWTQFGGGRRNIWANHYTGPFGPWGIPVLIETDNAGDMQRPEVAVDSSGNAVVVWQQDFTTGHDIWSNRYTTSTGTWGTPVPIDTGTGVASFPRIAVDGSGNAVVVWHQRDGTGQNIWSNRYNASTGIWYAPVLIETDDRGDATTARVAVDGSGNAVAVWTQWDGTQYGIWSNTNR